MVKNRSAMAGAMLATLAAASLAQERAISDGVVKIGVLTDMTGAYADITGAGSVLATRMAVADFVVQNKPSFKVEVVTADHQNKPDVASNIAREWFERDGVDMITEVVTSSVALAVSKVAQASGKLVTITGAATADLTGKDCNAATMHWVYDTYALAVAAPTSIVKAGGTSWYFVTADYAFGHALESAAATGVRTGGGEVVGSSRYPFPGTDFSSYLLKAQASKAKVIGLANAGTDLINSVKQAGEFGITGKQQVVGLLLTALDVHAIGLEASQGMFATEAWYWDLNDDTRSWAKRFHEQHKRMPSMMQAGTYSSVYHYLKSVHATGTDAGAAVRSKMEELPINDMFAKNGRLRRDGRMVHDMYLLQVKTPAESKYPWDYYKLIQTIPGDSAFRPMDKGNCPLVAAK